MEENPKLSIYICTNSLPKYASRQYIHIRQMNLHSDLFFVDTQPVPGPIPTVTFPSASLSSPKDHFGNPIKHNSPIPTAKAKIIRMNYSMHHFLQSTNSWYLFIDDDAQYSPKHVSRILNYLSTKGDPLTTAKMYGGLFCFDLRSPFLGGGAGFLFTRKCVEIIIPFFVELMFQYPNEDITTLLFMHIIGQNVLDGQAPGMTHEFVRSFYRLISGRKYSKFPQCNPLTDQRIENSTYFQLKYLLTVHHSWDFDSFNTTWSDVFEEEFPDFLWYYPNTHFRACKAFPHIIDQFPSLFPIF